jgi:hypothetical protein
LGAGVVAGVAPELPPEFAASLDGDGVGTFVAGAALAGVLSVAGFVAGLPPPGAEECAVESGVGCAAAGVVGAAATFGGGVLAVVDVGGDEELASLPSGFCTTAGVLLVPELSPGNP